MISFSYPVNKGRNKNWHWCFLTLVWLSSLRTAARGKIKAKGTGSPCSALVAYIINPGHFPQSCTPWQYPFHPCFLPCWCLKTGPDLWGDDNSLRKVFFFFHHEKANINLITLVILQGFLLLFFSFNAHCVLYLGSQPSEVKLPHSFEGKLFLLFPKHLWVFDGR